MSRIGRIIMAGFDSWRGTFCGMMLALGLLSGPAHSQTAVTRELGDGASVTVTLSPDSPERRLSIDLPPFARWSPSGFEAPIDIRIAANYLAFIDRWRLTFYRTGDTKRLRPLRSFEGAGIELPARMAWDGRIDSGPRLRPGETIEAELVVRDLAGNIDRSPPQSLLLARYLMPREQSNYDKERAVRSSSFSNGASPLETGIPVTGYVLDFSAKDWTNEALAGVSGMAIDIDKKRGEARQILPPGRYSFLLQRIQRIEGASPAITPVASLALDLPPISSKQVPVKGTGTLERLPLVSSGPEVEGASFDGAVAGNAALSLMPVEDDGLARMLLAAVDPEKPVHLYRDARKRRVVLASQDQDGALWAGPNAPRRPVEAPEMVEQIDIQARFPARSLDELVLPNTDIIPGSLRIDITMDNVPLRGLAPGRDYFTEFAEGRVKLTSHAVQEIAPALETAENFGREAVLRVSYSILRVPAQSGHSRPTSRLDIADSGASLLRHNAQAAGVVEEVLTGEPVPKGRGMVAWIGSLWDRLF